jgi:hypothetical protein
MTPSNLITAPGLSVQIFGSRVRRLHSFIVLCENHASRVHRGEIGARFRKGAEALGRKPESAIRDFEPVVAVRAAAAMSESALAAS